jgi:hypothetical protein
LKTPIVFEDSRVPQLLSYIFRIWGITLWPFIFVRGKLDPITLRHETIHIRQQAELLVVPFYLLYACFWLYRWAQLGDKKAAYYAIPFEREAYSNHEDASYLALRRPFAWVKYVRIQPTGDAS